ncbi:MULTISPECIES: FdtA/QdtA family cupin domain-containing protein [Gammaproteobacteria]|uniref:sugar 3,4-ketoisomerase n=1 Tax=Gammaproteobacteria TaxID=1236 RepID=UPI000DD01251|nr:MULTISPECIES: FdtA/QdtA family cupin domain-containing protein [Gammaproteobacteria]RTE86831.1 WxcM-like domain-containing protein [Aliidiomarina sp. B3213]TCZ93380.1 WxcM-like domain-containing protein [Lysobacter sp. N42]
MSLLEFVDFPPLGDERGSLVALESDKTVPFPIKRVYYIFGTQPGVSRGFHAHKKLKQVAVCVTGKCKMVLDNGKQREETWLDSPTKGLVIDNMTWREMHDFSEDCVLLVLASEHYSEEDYIRSYDDFIRQVTE